jgi:hypothetical protein
MAVSERVIRTYVLRLLVDRDQPRALRGLVHSVASGAEHPFPDGAALLELLCRMADEAPARAGGPPAEPTRPMEGSEP